MSKIKLNPRIGLPLRSNIHLLGRLACALLISFNIEAVYAKTTDATTVDQLSLAEITERVKAYQNSQGVWQAQQDIADANIKNSQLWNNPTLQVDRTGFKNDQDQEWAVSLSQPLDVFGQRRASRALAHLSKQQASLKQMIYDQQLAMAVKSLWSQVMLAEIETRLLNEQLKVSLENLAATEKRFQAGSIAQVDVERVRLTQTNLTALVQQADLTRQTLKNQLFNLWGQSTVSNAIGDDFVSMWPQDTLTSIEQNRTENLVEKSLKLDELETSAQMALLKAKARPNPDINLGVKRTKTAQNQVDSQLVLGVSVPLKLFNRNQYATQIAQVKSALIEKQQNFYQTQNQLDVQTLVVELNQLKSQFDFILQQQIPLAVRVQKRTLEGFKAGKFNVMDVQQATAQLLDIRLQSVQLLKSAWQKSIEAQSLSLGIDPSIVTSKNVLVQLNQALIQETKALPVIEAGN
ncbi:MULTISPECIES: TolC family protein [unclassified Acinetobacter]|uniref:TolC family protein n=1 Tax=unclassified Acinetobacter TaxID=196816 RepID=UPI0029345395|nr:MULTISPECIES: TolC family protein [unclassified Acinetobacter]WOE31049.1 TolC family protein [Acinetobacter sp. SAAs470]WOE39245.1 TolC family protein [Acinetobacter sp. SAAs474]